ncbi:DUF4097 domain-containing protein [Eubacteriales bacterium OttesenSCG-928-M02]|nr:DUF4097 domain-containing protein [Eubacteriales bacterium OttesenSCG-928-M02]
MNATQKTIKYIAMAFALALALFIIFMIVNGVIFGLSIFGLVADNSSGSSEVVDGEYSYSQAFTGVTGLKVEQEIGQLTIRLGDEFRVEAQNPDKGIQVENKNGTLIVKNKANNFLNWGADETRTVITLPRDVVLEKADISLGAGKGQVEQLLAKELYIDTGAGSFRGSHLYGERVDITGGVGEVRLEDVDFANLKLECGVGALYLSGRVKGNSKVESGVGEARLALTGSRADYRLKLDVGIGEIRVDGEKLSDGTHGAETAAHFLAIDGGIGAVILDFSGEADAPNVPDQTRSSLLPAA